MKNKILKFIKENQPGILSVIIFLLLWEMAVRLGVVERIFTSLPSEIGKESVKLLGTHDFWNSFGYSLVIFYIGFLLAVICGFAAGLVIGFFEKANKIFKPYVFVLSALPMAAMVPLLIIWFGIGMASKIAIVFLMVLVPVVINTIEGAKNADKELKNMAKSFGADDFKILKSVVLFSALPFTFSGAKIGVGRGIVGLVISEIFGYGTGLGYLVSYYGNTFQPARLFTVIIALISVNFITVLLIDLLRRKIIKWE